MPSATLTAYRQWVADSLGGIDLRALPGLAASPEAIRQGLAATIVLPELVEVYSEPKPRMLGDVLACERHVVIRGEPGDGKTTLLRCLCLAFAEVEPELLPRICAAREPKPGAPGLPEVAVPVLLRLTNFRPGSERAHELDAWMRRILAEDRGETCADEVMAAVHGGRGLVCLDGLDEIGHEGMRQRVALVIEAWTAQHDPLCWVTTRTHGALVLRGFSSFAVKPFGGEQLREYLIRRERARGTDLAAAKQLADEWLRRFADRPETLEVLRHPLLLVMATTQEDAGLLLPTQRTDLYRGMIDMLIGTWNMVRRPEDALRRATGLVLDHGRLRRALAATALRFHEDGMLGRPVHRETWTRALARQLGGGESGEEYAEGVLDVLIEQVGLLVPEGPALLRIWHASLGEYLAATALARVASERPQHIVRSMGSIQGREMTRMAIACARAGDGPSPVATRLYAVLLAPDSGGPWTRLFGEPVRVAVDCLRDGHPLDEHGFSRVLARVLDLVERAPLWANAETLGELAVVQPRHVPDAAEERRLIALLRAEVPLLPWHVAARMTRWIAGATSRSAEARTYCEHVLTIDRATEKLWAALGLLRAGVVRADACRVVADHLEHRPPREEEARATVVLRELESESGALATGASPGRVALRELLTLTADAAPVRRVVLRPPAITDEGRARCAAAAILALLGEEDDDVLAVVIEGGHSGQPYRIACRVVLARMARTSEAVRRRLAGALLAGGPEREVAEDVLKDIFAAADGIETAADVVFGALARAGGALPDARGILVENNGTRFMDNTRTFYDVLRSFAWSGRDALVALSRRCSEPSAANFHARWALATALWEQVHVRDDRGSVHLGDCLFEGAESEDVTVAVTSSCRLAWAWDRCGPRRQRVMVAAWLRGLRCADAQEGEGEPVDAVCLAAWKSLARHAPRLDEASRADLCVALASEHPLQRLVTACVLRPDLHEGPRCEAMLLQALDSDDLQLVGVALRGLDTGESGPDRGGRLLVAAIRLVLRGRLAPVWGQHPPTRAMLEVFLAAPCTISVESRQWRTAARGMLQWLAQYEDTWALASAQLLAPDRSRAARAALLMVAWGGTPERLTEVIAEAMRGGSRVRAAVASALQDVLESSGDEASLLREVARRGLGELLRERLRSDDLDAVHATVRKLCWYSVFVAELPAARGRLLAGPELAGRVAEVFEWMAIRCEPEQREEFARDWFGVGIAEVAAALRPCVEIPQAWAALGAGLLLAQLCRDVEALRTVAHRILGAPSPAEVRGENERYDELAWLLRTQAAREFFGATSSLPEPRRLACAALVELEDDSGLSTLRDLVIGPDGLLEGWYGSGVLSWLARHRPGAFAELEPEIARGLVQGGPYHVRNVVGWLRPLSGIAPTLLSAMAQRWSDWLYTDPFGGELNFAAFTGYEGSPPEAVRARWRCDLEGCDAEQRGRAALALAHCAESDDAITAGLIEVFLRRVGFAAGRAWDRLNHPEVAASFARHRRDRAQRWQTVDEAWELVGLWSAWEGVGTDGDVLVPLLRAVMQAPDDKRAYFAALDLWNLDRAAATTMLRELSGRLTAAAAFLLDQGDPAGEARLWWELEQAAEDEGWEAAALVLYRRDPSEPRLPGALARILARSASPQALWLMFRISREAALCAELERLARAGGSNWDNVQGLNRMLLGAQPGQAPYVILGGMLAEFPVSLRDATEQPFNESEENLQLQRFLSRASTLESLASNLLEAWREVLQRAPELPTAMAILLGGEWTSWTALWERAQAGACGAAEVAAIREIVDLRPDDRPGQRLARLWWRLQLPAAMLLEQEERGALDGVPAGAELSKPQHLALLLGEAFPDVDSLRGFLADLGLDGEIAVVGASHKSMQYDAALLLAHHGRETEAVQRAHDIGALRGTALAGWERRSDVSS